HESIVCNHVTDVDGTDRGGIRWYELRRTGGGPWAIYQQGTYSPDTDDRWMGAININAAGQIGLLYNRSSSSTFPGIYYTARNPGDPLGIMSEPEMVAITGSASNGSNRYGDYNSLSVDPTDEATFWGTAMYNSTSQWSTRIVAFNLELADPEIRVTGMGTEIFSGDVSPSPTDGTDLGNVAIDGGTGSSTYTIHNDGGVALSITSITSNNPLFAVSGIPASVASGASETFTVTFDPGLMDCDPATATITINNNDGDEGSFTFVVGAIPVDNVSPTISDCDDPAPVSNDPDLCGANVTVPVPTTDDNCAVQSLTNDWNNSASATDFYPVGETEVTWTVTDEAGLTATCAVTVIVTDDEKPKYNQATPDETLYTEDGADCPNSADIVSLARDRATPLTVGNLPVPYTVAGIAYETPTDMISDNCTDPADIEVYVWDVDLDYDGLADDYYRQIRLVFRIFDEAGNGRNRDILYTIIDNTPPILACASSIKVEFNGEDYLSMADYLADLVDLDNTYDECGDDDISFSYDPAYITCDQLGETIDVEVTVCDGADPANCTSCTVPVTVDGLPCGWMTFDDHIDCEGSSADYDVPSETFYLTSSDCSHPPYAPFDEEYAYVKTVLCGDGELIAQVTGLDGLGKAWAGIVMREGHEPSSKKFQLMTGLDYLQHRVDWISSTGGNNQTQSFSRYGQHWLRIVRTGPIFQAYTSYNGTVWGQPVATQVIAMQECLEVGLVVTNVPYASNVTASFNHVELTPPYVPSVPPMMRPFVGQETADQALTLDIAPNPTTGQLTLNLSAFREQDATLEVMDINGQLILQRQLGVIENSTEQLDLSPYAAGMYFVRLRTEDGTTAVQRVILQPRP
ncbi:MAG: choice-of-anchor D domain-containing protein, partial [Lewinella sp.]|nr:choice-of-anchor D domain-containing protein [Lewinella sp.]